MSARTIQAVSSALLVALVLYLDYRVLQSFLIPLAWAGVLGVFLYPVHRWIRGRIRRPNLAAGISLLAGVLLVVIPVAVVGVYCVTQGLALAASIPTAKILPQLQAWIETVTSRLPVETPQLQSEVAGAAKFLGAFLARHSAAAAGGLAGFILNLFVMLLALFYLLRDGPALVRFVAEIAPFSGRTSTRIFGEINTMVMTTLQSSLLVAAAQGVVAGLVFWVLGLPAPVFWAVAAMALALLPLVGPAILWLGAALVLFLQGETWRAVAMLLLGNFGISGIDNVLRPMLISGQSQLNGLLAMVGALGGLYAFGFVGIVLGPMLAAVTVGMVKGYHESLVAGPEIAPPDTALATPPESRTEPPPETAERHPSA